MGNPGMGNPQHRSFYPAFNLRQVLSGIAANFISEP
jgi:hypothetical protein